MSGIFAVLVWTATFLCDPLLIVASQASTNVKAPGSQGVHRCLMIQLCASTKKLITADAYCAYTALDNAWCVAENNGMKSAIPVQPRDFQNDEQCALLAQPHASSTHHPEYMYVSTTEVDLLQDSPECVKIASDFSTAAHTIAPWMLNEFAAALATIFILW